MTKDAPPQALYSAMLHAQETTCDFFKNAEPKRSFDGALLVYAVESDGDARIGHYDLENAFKEPSPAHKASHCRAMGKKVAEQFVGATHIAIGSFSMLAGVYAGGELKRMHDVLLTVVVGRRGRSLMGVQPLLEKEGEWTIGEALTPMYGPLPTEIVETALMLEAFWDGYRLAETAAN